MRNNSYPKRGYRYSWIAISFARILEKIFPRPRFGQGASHHSSPSILFIELFGLGDVASLSVTFDPLLKRFPTAKISILCQPWCATFYANDSRVFEVIGMPTPWKSALADLVSWTAWASVIRMVRQMRKKRFDWCIETRGDIRSQVLARWIQPIRLVGPRDYMGSNMILRGKLLSDNLGILPPRHRYQRNCDCLLPILGISVEALLPSLPHKFKNVNFGTTKRLLIHTGGGWMYRHWPEERWRRLLLDLLKKNEWEIAVLCAPGEERIIERISEGTSVKIERPSLNELLPTIQSYDVMIATDSGPINIAILSGIPVVDIMGPGDSFMWGPPPGRGILLQNVENYSCYPCLQKRCVSPLNPCIRQVSLEDVKGSLEKIWSQVETERAVRGLRISSPGSA